MAIGRSGVLHFREVRGPTQIILIIGKPEAQFPTSDEACYGGKVWRGAMAQVPPTGCSISGNACRSMMPFDVLLTYFVFSLVRLIKVPNEGKVEKHPVYQLLPFHQPKNDGPRGPPQQMSEKTMYLTAKITEHDLSTKIRSLQKWLHKGAVIRVIITASAQNQSALVGQRLPLHSSI